MRSLRGITPDEPKQRILPTLAYPSGHAETLAANYLALWGRPLQFASFEMVANDDAKLDRIRGLHLWRRISLFDGNETHFGFVARRRWVYGKETIVHITFMEDFTEGGDISIPFRDPFEWVLNSIPALDMFFDRASALNNQGAWEDDTGGSTPTNQTGPTANNTLAFCHTETSGGNQADHEDNGVITVLDDPFGAIRNRDVVFRYAAYGDFVAGDGLVVQGREVLTTLVDDLIVSESDRSIWRINLADLTDVTAPFGNLGTVSVLPVGIAIDANGDAITVSQTRLFRVNLAAPADTTGDYGEIADITGHFQTGERSEGIAIDANGDAIVVTDDNFIYRLSVNDPTLDSGIYGQLGFITPAPGNAGNTRGVAIDANGDAIVVYSGGSLRRVDLSDPTDISGRYGSLGDLVGPEGASGWQGIAILSNGNVVTFDENAQVYVSTLGGTNDTIQSTVELETFPSGLTSQRGLSIIVREVTNFGAWTDISTLPASTYPAGNLSEGDTDTDVEGDDYTVTADGGWRDVTVSIPSTYQQIRLRPNLNAGGNAVEQDIALRSVRSADYSRSQLGRPAGLSLTESGGDITAGWNDVADATGYVLEWREEGSGDAWQTANVAAPPHTFTP